MEHTPGREEDGLWEVHVATHGRPYWLYHIEGAEREAHEADGRLISAAPAMLAALERLLDECAQFGLAEMQGWRAFDEARAAVDAAAA